jgi:hypothetical protein
MAGILSWFGFNLHDTQPRDSCVPAWYTTIFTDPIIYIDYNTAGSGEVMISLEGAVVEEEERGGR